MKTLYVPKGKTLHYERLECQTIIADGTLVVDGAARAKRITGKGLLDAGSVYSPAVSVRDLDTVKVVCDLLAAEYLEYSRHYDSIHGPEESPEPNDPEKA